MLHVSVLREYQRILNKPTAGLPVRLSHGLNKIKPEDQIPMDILHCNNADTVSKVLRYFVLEVRRSDGECYPLTK